MTDMGTTLKDEVLARKRDSPIEDWPVADPDVRCDACAMRGSLRVKFAKIHWAKWVVELHCKCIACGYDQKLFERAPKRRIEQ